jgi:hypothetical protein
MLGLGVFLAIGAAVSSSSSTSAAAALVHESDGLGKNRWPHPKEPVERFVVNLDLPPRERWKKVIAEKVDALKALLDIIEVAFKLSQPKVTRELVDASMAGIENEYLEEMRGIAEAANVSVSDVMMANMYYEISGVADTPLDLSKSCTSIVTQNANKTIYFGRNQDYPPPFTLVMIHAVFEKGGVMQYEGTTFAGTIGLATAMVPKGWAASINARGNPKKGTAKGIDEAIAAAQRGASIFPIFIRKTMDSIGPHYNEAVLFMRANEMIMSGFIIMGGSHAGEGAILTKNATSGLEGTDVFSIFSEPSPAGGAWYVVQTNTDHWLSPPASAYGYNISRREAAVEVLDQIGEQNIDLDGVWRTLDTEPVFNPATIHTELVAPEWSEYQTWKRNGPL